MRTWVSILCLAVAVGLVFAGAASADPYPSKPIKLIVPFPAGTSPAEFAAYLRSKIDKWAEVVKTANLNTK